MARIQDNRIRVSLKLTASLLALSFILTPWTPLLAQEAMPQTTATTTTTIYPSKNFNTDGTTATKHIFSNGAEVGTVTGTGEEAVPRYVHTDNLTGSNIVTNSSDTIDETLDYFPFGGIRIDSGSYSDQRKYIGQEYDESTGLSYLNARYYDGVRGQFASQDPMFWGLPQQLLIDPQQQNSYSYARNNPINLSDPSGLLTVIVPGTFYDPKDWSSDGQAKDFIASVGKTFNETPQILQWSGKNNIDARKSAADSLIQMVKDHNFADGEKLNIIGHSHGGNIAIIASQNADMREIDSLVTLGTPNRTNYQPENVKLHTNAYSRFDAVQKAGEVGDPLNIIGDDSRKFNRAENVGVGLRAGILPRASHSNLWKNPSVWSLVDKKIKTGQKNSK